MKDMPRAERKEERRQLVEGRALDMHWGAAASSLHGALKGMRKLTSSELRGGSEGVGGMAAELATWLATWLQSG